MVFSVVLWRIRSWKLSLEHSAGGLHSKISRTLEGANVSTAYTIYLLPLHSNLFWETGIKCSMYVYTYVHAVCKHTVCTYLGVMSTESCTVQLNGEDILFKNHSKSPK